MTAAGFVVALLTLAAPNDFEARPAAGPAIVGTLADVDADGFTIAMPEGEKRLGFDQTLSVRRRASVPPPPEAAPILARLVDGSELHAREIVAKNGDAEIQLVEGGTLTTLVRSIASVRFAANQPDAALDSRWEQIVATERAGDLVVVRKVVEVTDEQGVTRQVVSLDDFEGVVGDVTPSAISFTFSGRTIEVNRDKIFGLAWYRPAGRELPETLCIVRTGSGNRFAVREMKSDGDRLAVALVSGARHDLPLDDVVEFDFSGGKIVYVSDLTPESVDYRPYLLVGDAALQELAARRFRPRMDRSIDAPEIRLFGETFDKGVVARSRTELLYRLPARFRRLQASVGVDDSVRNRLSRVRLIVEADGAVLYDGEFSGQDSEPVRLDLDVTGARRLKFTIDYADKSDAGDHLALGDLRLLE